MDVQSVGIDVSKDTLHVCFRTSSSEEVIIFPNTENGLKAIQRKLKSYKRIKILMESTGRYHLLCACVLSDKGFDVRVVNPIAAKRYISASVRKKKTDKADAIALADMALVHQNLPTSYRATNRDIQIRQKMGLLCSLEKQCTSLGLMMKNYVEFQEVLHIESSSVETDIQQTIAGLNKQRKQLEKEIEALIVADPTMKKKQALVVSIPGISPYCGSICCQLLDTNCVTVKQWIAFLGLDIPPRESGTWKGRSTLSKRGSPYVRKRLYSAAWGADPDYKAYYDRLKREGRHHYAILIIIARRLLTIMFSVLKNGVPYDSSRPLFLQS